VAKRILFQEGRGICFECQLDPVFWSWVSTGVPAKIVGTVEYEFLIFY